MLDFPLTGADDATVSILISKIVGLAQMSDRSVVLYVEGGFKFEIAQDYDTVRAAIRNATGSRPF